MARLAFHKAVRLLCAVLAAGCLGGQTGQPSSGRCAPADLDATSAWSGTTVEAAAQVFEQPYTGSLQWQVEPRTSPNHTPVDFADTAVLAIVYSGGSASRDCTDQLELPVSVTLSSSQSGIAESGDATLTLWRSSQGLTALLHYESERVRLDATLPDPSNGDAPAVTLDALSSDLPGASASFTEGP